MEMDRILQSKDRVTGWIQQKQKQDPTKCCLPEAHCSIKDTYRLKVKAQKIYFKPVGTKKEQG